MALDMNSVLIGIASFLVTGYTLYLYRGKRCENNHGKQAPCLWHLPFVGSFPFFPTDLKRLPDFFMKMGDRLGPVFFFYAGRRSAVVITGKEAIIDAAVKHAEAFADRSGVWMEENILNFDLRGLSFSRYHERYKKNRKAVLSIFREFGFGNARKMNDSILEAVATMVGEIVKQNGKSFDPESLLIHSTSSVIISVLYGKQFRQISDDHLVITDASNRFLNNITVAIDAAPIARFTPKIRKRVERMVDAQTELMKSLQVAIEFNKTQSSENTFVKRYLEITESDYDKEELLYTLRDLTMGSTTTIAGTVMWALIELANHPEVQKRVQAEIDEAIPDKRFPNLDDKSRLPYTEAMLLEVWRIRNPTPTLPQATLKDTQVCGYFVPKDCMVILNMHSVTMDPKTWSEPDKFRPERFLDINNKVIGRDTIFPFGMGKRSCVGEIIARPETFLFVASLAQCFDILPPEGCNSIDAEINVGLIINPTSFKIRLIPRRDRDLPI